MSRFSLSPPHFFVQAAQRESKGMKPNFANVAACTFRGFLYLFDKSHNFSLGGVTGDEVVQVGDDGGAELAGDLVPWLNQHLELAGGGGGREGQQAGEN